MKMKYLLSMICYRYKSNRRKYLPNTDDENNKIQQNIKLMSEVSPKNFPLYILNFNLISSRHFQTFQLEENNFISHTI